MVIFHGYVSHNQMVIVGDILRQVALDWVYADSCQCPKNKGIINFCSSCMVGLGGYLGTTAISNKPAISAWWPLCFSPTNIIKCCIVGLKHEIAGIDFNQKRRRFPGLRTTWTTWTTWATRFLPEEWLPDEPCAVDVIESSQCHGCSRKMVDPKSQMFPNPNAPWCWYIYHYLPT